MQPYVLIVDSSADLPRALADELGIQVVSLMVTMEGEESLPNDQIDVKEFYAKLRAKQGVKTSAIGIETFNIVFEEHLKQGRDVLYLGFSSGLSSTYNAGFIAARECSARYPERTVATVDTLAASLGQGMLAYLAAKKKQEGASLEEVRRYIEDIKLKQAHWFTVDDLFFLKRGGRIGTTTAVVGSMLSIKPVLHVDNAGHLINVAKARGRRASLDALYSRMAETAINPEEQVIFISHGDCIEDAEYLANKIKAGLHVKDVIISEVGPVIGAHSGPGTMALFFLASGR